MLCKAPIKAAADHRRKAIGVCTSANKAGRKCGVGVHAAGEALEKNSEVPVSPDGYARSKNINVALAVDINRSTEENWH